MKKLLKVASILIIGLAMASCTTFKFEGTQITKELPSYTNVGTFEITVKVSEFLGSSGGANLLNVTSDAMNTKIFDAIQREIQKASADAAINVSIEYKASFIDMILNSMTFSLYAPATAVVKGTLVKY